GGCKGAGSRTRRRSGARRLVHLVSVRQGVVERIKATPQAVGWARVLIEIATDRRKLEHADAGKTYGGTVALVAAVSPPLAEARGVLHDRSTAFVARVHGAGAEILTWERAERSAGRGMAGHRASGGVAAPVAEVHVP